MRLFIPFFFLLVCQICSAQVTQNLSGLWKGELIQDPHGLAYKYEIKFQLVQSGPNIAGQSYSGIKDDSLQANARLVLKGSLYNNKFIFTETGVEYEQIETDSVVWCLKKGKLRLVQQLDGTQKLYGTWTAQDKEGNSCHGGEMTLIRKTNEAPPEPEVVEEPAPEVGIKVVLDSISGLPIRLGNRRIKTGKVVDVYTSKVGLNVFDHKEKDSDVISLFYNGNWILENYSLESGQKNIIINVPARSKDNYLILYAHNLGDIPPNTAGIQFFNGEREQMHVLNSDLGECDVLYFNHVVK